MGSPSRTMLAILLLAAAGAYGQTRTPSPDRVPRESELLSRIVDTERDSLYWTPTPYMASQPHLELGFNIMLQNCHRVNLRSGGHTFTQLDLADLIQRSVSTGLRTMITLGSTSRRDVAVLLDLMDPHAPVPITITCETGRSMGEMVGGHAELPGTGAMGPAIVFHTGDWAESFALYDEMNGMMVELGGGDEFRRETAGTVFHELIHLLGLRAIHLPENFELSYLYESCVFPNIGLPMTDLREQEAAIQSAACGLLRDRPSLHSLRYAQDYLRVMMLSTSRQVYALQSAVVNRVIPAESAADLMVLSRLLSDQLIGDEYDADGIDLNTGNRFLALVLAAVAVRDAASSAAPALRREYDALVVRYFPPMPGSAMTAEQRFAEHFAAVLVPLLHGDGALASEANETFLANRWPLCVALSDRRTSLDDILIPSFSPVLTSFERSHPEFDVSSFRYFTTGFCARSSE